MTQANDPQRWARLRFAVVGPLLAAPPPPGQLQTALRKLSEQHWRHPNTGLPVSFGVSTIEAWYYKAKKAQDPVSSLSRARRQDAGRARVFTASAVAQIHALYRQNPTWSVQLHYDNLCACSDLEPDGRWIKPVLLGIIDDHSRLGAHLQWYRAENTQSLVHGFCQALAKRGLPRAYLTDNGSAMISDEFTAGLHTLGIVHERTLPLSPHQNGKQENLWATLEGRLMAMIGSTKDLTLEQLNLLTQVWLEQDYHRKRHSEIATTPLQRFTTANSAGRDAPDSETLRRAFCKRERRKQRRSDGTCSLEGMRFEIPSRFGKLESVTLRLLASRLSTQRDISVGVLSHATSNIADFYREMGDVFGVTLRPHNRWGGFKALRERWVTHSEATHVHRVLLADEAQEMPPAVLNELRLLTSDKFDSRSLLSVVLAGDARLNSKLMCEDLLPLSSRIRICLALEPSDRDTLVRLLVHLVSHAGNASLMTPELMKTLAEHAMGNPRILCATAAELLAAAAHQEISVLDEKLYLEHFSTPHPKRARKAS